MIRRQSDYYSPEDVDYIVPIKFLNRFWKNIIFLFLRKKRIKLQLILNWQIII